MRKINILEGGRVSLGAQNRPQEAPRADTKRHRKKKNEKRRTEEHQERQKELQKTLPPFAGNDEKERRAVWSAEAPREPPCALFDKQ